MTHATETLHSRLLHLPLDGKLTEVAYHSFPSAPGTILMLHEALGSVSYWKAFPNKLAHATGYNVIVYSRAGHGDSEGPVELRTDDYYLQQVQVVIPTLLQHFSVDCPVLYGHSEGAGIALLYAAKSDRVKALLLESPFVIGNQAAGQVIQQMAAAYSGSKLQERLAHYHQNPDEVFHSWVRWAASLGKEIFPLRDFLPDIACPVLVLQGASDEFGITMQLAALQASIADVQHETFADTGHLPHREQTERVLQRVSRFLSSLPLSTTPLSNMQPLTGGCNS
jgi:pimeloyl-ACP methyl ester carboxylesterase